MDVWHIVEFSMDNTAAIIPKSWVIQNEKKAYWPPYKNVRKIENAVKNQEDPQTDTWNIYDIQKVFSTAKTYDEAVIKGDIALYTSEVDEEYEKSQDKSLRSARHKKSVESTSTSDEDNEVQSKKKKLQFDKFPSQPLHSKFDFQKTVDNEESKSYNKMNMKAQAQDEYESSSSSLHQNPEDATIASESSQFDFNEWKYSEQMLVDPMKWCVVQFTDDQKKQVIPGLWLQDSDQVSLWPPYKCLNMIEEASEERKKPESDWRERQIYKLLETTDTYTKALQLTADKEGLAEREISQRDDSRDRNKSSTSPQMKNEPENTQVKPQHPKPVIKSVQVVKKPFDIPQPHVEQSSRMPLAEISNLSDKNQYSHIFEMVSEILQNQAEEKVKLDALILNRGNSNKSSLNVEEMEQMQSIFPINSFERFMKLHEDLKEKEWQLKFKLFFGCTGGRTAHLRLRNILAGLITKNVAVQFSFAGRKKHPFRNHNVWKNLLNIAVTPNSQYTKYDAEETTKSWLKEANKIKYKKSASTDSAKDVKDKDNANNAEEETADD